MSKRSGDVAGAVPEASGDAVPDAGIVLEGVTKRFGGQELPAVDDVSLTVASGEIVVLLGPSGSGKTTMMRMINRLIEPTAGRITVAGRDTMSLDPNELRRRIGYVIQDAGLFPHMSVATNVAQVPLMLKWSKERIAERVDELLRLVDLDPAIYRDRHPRELSGGQRQRVGVARALAADPPVMLMDEPFGALDPITREHLQDSLLDLQAELGKTIVFVTHDIDEALRIGNRIAILDKGSRIAQYGTPQEILLDPADDYVRRFIGGGGQGVRLLKFSRVGDVPLVAVPEAGQDDDADAVRERIAADGFGVVLDERRRPVRWITPPDLEGVRGAIGERGEAVSPPIRASATLQRALEALIEVDHEWVPVVGAKGDYRGAVTLATLQRALKEMRREVCE